MEIEKKPSLLEPSKLISLNFNSQGDIQHSKTLNLYEWKDVQAELHPLLG